MSARAADWAPCSDLARERADPLVGTGPRGMRWFLVEIDTGWGHNAFLDRPFDRALGKALLRRIEAVGMRALAIRRTGRRTPQARQRWAIVDSRPGLESVVWGDGADAASLLEVPLDGSTGTPSSRPIFAVCTHGRHDRCCAVRGRRVVTELAAEYPEETWECSHLGGDRFAGTMVVFPHGLYYGYADDGDPVRIADAFVDGRIVPERYRGRSSLPHPVQAAQHYARAEFDDDRIETFAPVEDASVPGEAASGGMAAAENLGDGSWRVRLRARGSGDTGIGGSGDAMHVVVDLEETLSPPLLSTCAATQFVRVRQYELGSIRTVRD